MLAHLGAMLAHLGAVWAHLGAMLAHLVAMLAHLGAMLGPSWGYVCPACDPCWAMWGLCWASFRAFWCLFWAIDPSKPQNIVNCGIFVGSAQGRRRGGKPLSPTERREGLRQCRGHGGLGPLGGFNTNGFEQPFSCSFVICFEPPKATLRRPRLCHATAQSPVQNPRGHDLDRWRFDVELVKCLA